jgi:hypothetical protein
MYNGIRLIKQDDRKDEMTMQGVKGDKITSGVGKKTN